MSLAATIKNFACPKCDALLGANAAGCLGCGTESRPAASPAASPDFTVAVTPAWAWIHDRRTMLFVLLAGVGALGLPLLWLSRAFRFPAKVGWSIVVTVETALLCWACWSSVQSALDAFGRLAR